MKKILVGIFVLLNISNQAQAFRPRLSFFNTWLDVQTGLSANFNMDSTAIVETVSGTPLTSTVVSNITFPAKNNGGLKLKTLSGSMVPSNTMTACAWMNWPVISNPDSWAVYYGFGRKSGNVTYNGTVWYRLSPGGYFSGTSQVAEDTATRTNPLISVLNDASFHHYCTTLDNVSKVAKTYRDGVLVYTANGILKWNQYGTNINFLNEIVDTSDDTHAPLVDEWKVYNRILSFEEIQRLAQKGSAYAGGLIQNGDFSNGLTSWTGSLGTFNQTVANAGTVAVSTGTVGSNYFRQTISTEIGATYRVTFTIKSVSGTAGTALESHAMEISQDPRNGTKLNGSPLYSSAGTYSYTFNATAINTMIVFATEVGTGNCIIDNISVFKI